ncbi:multicopper oxidase family protein [uncultured Serinicoccus sp.]|uniref:multicopper oxidase family protein n=1 Tax=uncultured Serinicoccus sp. TaxID=735514 RepID=UPI0026112E50|nr:multicopper oxidase family protein [uncultured Serinicoccus sp.]
MIRPSRRQLIIAGLGLGASATLAACSGDVPVTSRPTAPFGLPEPVPPSPGQSVVSARLTARPVTLDLGGRTVQTWAYGDSAPGATLRATAGDLLRVTLDNQLPADTTVHWHGVRLRPQADGVPGLTQDPVRVGKSFLYEFTVPDPGTYFFHPHVGTQLDRGLYAPLIIDDPAEPGDYDLEWVLVLDDWVDGTGTTPEEVLEQLVADGASGTDGTDHGTMAGMDHGSMSAGRSDTPWGTDTGDVDYPYYLINGRPPTDPPVLQGRAGQRVRLRVISAASDTIFTVALGGHRMTLTHTDGWPVRPVQTDAFYIGMGERYDATVTLGSGVFPLVARPQGGRTGGQGLAVVRTATGTLPPADVTPEELDGKVLTGSQLQPDDAGRLPNRGTDVTAALRLGGSMAPYVWTINGAPYGQNEALRVAPGQRLRLDATNMTMMPHPLHLHGHTFALPNGLRKDTLLMAPMESVALDLDADNPGDWMIHCHNIYHAEAGMMIDLRYT